MPTQKESNPFKFSDTNKRYHTYDYYLKHTFGGKCLKIPLDIGCTCPNIDGTKGFGGCIYCSARGSGDFAASPVLSVAEQCEAVRSKLIKKWDASRIIPYFQAHTNTYADVRYLEEKFSEALALSGTVAVNIATRADCLGEAVLSLLASLAEKITLTVELGLQSSNDTTAAIINRGHTYDEFVLGYNALRQVSDKIRIGVHIINGLPGESENDMEKTAADIASLRPDEIKIHLLHVIKNTRIAEMYEQGEYVPMTFERYVSVVARQLSLMPSETVIGRVTGDGAADELLAPLWSLKKTVVINAIDKFMYQENLWQGKTFLE